MTTDGALLKRDQHAATTIAVWNSKGGSTKTNTLLQLGAELRLLGYRVLMVDLYYNNPALTYFLLTDEERETQLTANATSTRLIAKPEAGHVKLVRVADMSFTSRDTDGELRYNPDLLEKVARERGWQQTNGELGVIPGAMRPLANALKKLDRLGTSGDMSRSQTELVLRRALEKARQEYDFILLDCPPALPEDSLGLMNELKASTHVLIPLPMEYVAQLAALTDIESIQGLNQEYAQAGAPERIEILGVLPTRYRDGIKTHRQLRARFERSATLEPLLFQTYIPEDVACADAQVANVPVQLLAPNEPVSHAIATYTREVLDRVQRPSIRA